MRRALQQMHSLCLSGLLFIVASPACATLLVYEQTSASVPGLSISASMTVDGGLSDLPTLNQSSSPINFGNLLKFDLLAPNGVTYTLADFVAPFNCSPLCFPQWSISPSGIVFINATDSSDFIITFALGTIQFDTDGPSNLGCNVTGTCVTTGNWRSIAEPSSTALILVGLSALAFWRRWTLRPWIGTYGARRYSFLSPEL